MPKGIVGEHQILLNQPNDKDFELLVDKFYAPWNFYFKASQTSHFRKFEQWHLFLKTQFRTIQNDIIARDIHLIQLRKALWNSIKRLRKNIISPFFYDQQLQKLIERLKRISTVPKMFMDAFEETRVRLQEKLKSNPPLAFDYFQNDLINGIISVSAKPDDSTLLPAILTYYKRLILPEFYWLVAKEIKEFLDRDPSPEDFPILIEKINQMFLDERKGRNLEAEQIAKQEISKENTSWLPNAFSLVSKIFSYAQAHPVQVLIGGLVAHSAVMSFFKHYTTDQKKETLTSLTFVPSFSPTFEGAMYNLATILMGYRLNSYISISPNLGIAGVSLLSAPWMIPSTYAQTITNQDTFFLKALNGNRTARGSALVQTPEGELVLAGSIDVRENPSISWSKYSLVAKYNVNGTLLWARVFAKNSREDYAITTTADSGIVAVGTADRARWGGIYDISIVKFSTNGSLNWAKTLRRSENYPSFCNYGYAVCEASDGALMLAGKTKNCNSGSPSILLAKLSNNGTFIWGETIEEIPNSAWGGVANALTCMNDGGVILSGSNDKKIFTAKFTTNGELSWARSLGKEYANSGLTVTKTKDGGFVLGGNFYQGAQQGNVIAKFLSSGMCVWASTLEQINYSEKSRLTSITENADGSLLIKGVVQSPGTTSNGGSFLTKLLTNNTLAWVRTWDKGDTDAHNYNSYALELIDGQVAMLGTTINFGTTREDSSDANIMLGVFDASGEIPGCNALNFASTTKITAFSINTTDITSMLNVRQSSNLVMSDWNDLSFQEITLREIWECGSKMPNNFPQNPTLTTVPPLLQTIGGSWNDVGYGLAGTTDGGLVFVGATQGMQTDPSNPDILVTKFSANGTMAWSYALGGTKIDMGRAVLELPDESLLIIGETNSFRNGGGVYESNERATLLLKLNNTGAYCWGKVLEGGYDGENGYALTNTADGGFASVGWRGVSKFFADGTLAWTRGPSGNAIAGTSDGGVVVAGRSIAKLSIGGRAVWSCSLEGASNIYDLALTKNEEAVVVGASDSYNMGYNDFFVAKCSTDGKLNWAYALGGKGEEVARGVVETVDGNLLVVGHTGYSFANQYEVLVTKLTPEGELLWARKISGNNDALAHDLIKTTYGGFAVVGKTFNSLSGYTDVLLATCDQEGNIVNCASSQIVNPMVYPISLNIRKMNDELQSRAEKKASFSFDPYWWSINNISIQSIAPSIESCSIKQPKDAFAETKPANKLMPEFQMKSLNPDSPFLKIYTSKLLGGTNNSGSRAHTKTHDNGIVLAGSIDDLVGKGDMLVAKLWANNGTVAWARAFGGYGYESAFSIIETSENELVFSGISDSFSRGFSVVIAKLSQEGELIWVRRLKQKCLPSNEGRAVAEMANKDLVVVGSTHNGCAVGLLLTRLSQEGNLVWVKTLSAPLGGDAYNIKKSADGGFVLTGYTGVGAGQADMLVAKFNLDGSIRWIRALGGSQYDSGSSIVETENGDLIVTGTMTVRYNNILTTKLSANGMLIWARALEFEHRQGGFVTEAIDGYLITGETDVFRPTMLAKLSFDGAVVWARLLKIQKRADEENSIEWENVRYLTVTEFPNREIFITGGTPSYYNGDYSKVLIAKLNFEGYLPNCDAIEAINLSTYQPNITVQDIVSDAVVQDATEYYIWENWNTIFTQEVELTEINKCTENSVTTGTTGTTIASTTGPILSTQFLLSGGGAAISKTSDGGYIIGGLPLFTAKCDSKGHIVWARSFDNTNAASFHDITEMNDGRFAILERPNSVYVASYGDIRLAVLTSDGGLSWTSTLKVKQHTLDDKFMLVQGNDGNLIVAGGNIIAKISDNGWLSLSREIEIGNGKIEAITKTSHSTFAIIGNGLAYKFSNKGDLIWASKLGGKVYAITETADKGLVMAGNSNLSIFVTKFNVNGLFMWARTLNKPFGSLGSRENYAIIETADKELVVTAASSILKLSEDGILLWARKIVDEGRIFNGIYDVAEIENGNLVVVGGGIVAALDKYGNIPNCNNIQAFDISVRIPRIAAISITPLIQKQNLAVSNDSIITMQTINPAQVYQCGLSSTTQAIPPITTFSTSTTHREPMTTSSPSTTEMISITSTSTSTTQIVPMPSSSTLTDSSVSTGSHFSPNEADGGGKQLILATLGGVTTIGLLVLGYLIFNKWKNRSLENQGVENAVELSDFQLRYTLLQPAGASINNEGQKENSAEQVEPTDTNKTVQTSVSLVQQRYAFFHQQNETNQYIKKPEIEETIRLEK